MPDSYEMEEVDEVVEETADGRGRVSLGKEHADKRLKVAFKEIPPETEDTQT